MADERQLINFKLTLPKGEELKDIQDRLHADFDRMFGTKEISGTILDGPTDEELKAWINGATKDSGNIPD